MEDLSNFPHKTMEHRNGNIEIYFTSLNTIEARFEVLSAFRVKYHGFMMFDRDAYGYFKQPLNKSGEVNVSSYDVLRNGTNDKAEVKAINHLAEIINETAYGFVKQYPELLQQADAMMRKKEITRLKINLEKASESGKWNMFDKIEGRIFTLSLEQKTVPFKHISDKELGIE